MAVTKKTLIRFPQQVQCSFYAMIFPDKNLTPTGSKFSPLTWIWNHFMREGCCMFWVLKNNYKFMLRLHWRERERDVRERRRPENEKWRQTYTQNIFKVMEVCAIAKVPVSVLQCECHPYLQQKDLIDLCKFKKILFQAFSPLGSGDTHLGK